jgi:hypothetical protein
MLKGVAVVFQEIPAAGCAWWGLHCFLPVSVLLAYRTSVHTLQVTASCACPGLWNLHRTSFAAAIFWQGPLLRAASSLNTWGAGYVGTLLCMHDARSVPSDGSNE